MSAPAPRVRGDETLERKDQVSPFPLLDKESLKENIVLLATTALLGITTINVLSSTQGQDPLAKGAKHTALRKFLIAMPYSLFPAGLAGLAAAMAVQRRQRLLGFAAGFLLGEMMSLIIMGSLVTFVRADVSPIIVWPVTAGILVLLLVVWPVVCAYPKCLRAVFLCCQDQLNDNAGGHQQTCETCGASTVNGRSPNPASDGTETCQTCGGVAGGDLRAPSAMRADENV